MNGTNPGFISALSGSQSITTGWLGAATQDVQFHIHIQFSGRLWSSASSKQWFNKGCLSLRRGPCPSRAFQSIIPMTQIRSLRLKDMEGPGSHSSSKTQVRLLEWDPLYSSLPRCSPDVHMGYSHTSFRSAQIFTLPESSSNHWMQNRNTVPTSNFSSFLVFQSTHDYLTVIFIGSFVLCPSFSTRLQATWK